MTIASEFDELRDGLKSRMPAYGFFDGIAAALIVGFLDAIVPAPATTSTRKKPQPRAIARRSSAISSRITRG